MALYFSVPLTRSQRIKQRFTWAYVRQTPLILPIYMRWLNQ